MSASKQTFNLSTSIEYLRNISRSSEDSFLWPKKFKDSAIGGEVLAIQTLATWAQGRSNTHTVISSNISQDEVESFTKDYIRTPFGLSAAILSTEITVGRHIATGFFQKAQEQKLSELDRPYPTGEMKGPTLFVVCQEGLHSYPRSTYVRTPGLEPSVKDYNAFRSLLQEYLSSALSGVPSYSNSEPFILAVGQLTQELFSNTHFHARKNLSEQIYKRAVRGILCRTSSVTDKNIRSMAGSLEPLEEYLSRIPSHAAGGKRDFLEVSVFDSGPGMAVRFSSTELKDLSVGDEFNAITTCFKKHATTKNQSGKGNGLVRVLAQIKSRSGLLLIRTGRHALYATAEDIVDPESGELALHNVLGSTSELPPVSGTAVVTIFPTKIDENVLLSQTGTPTGQRASA